MKKGLLGHLKARQRHNQMVESNLFVGYSLAFEIAEVFTMTTRILKTWALVLLGAASSLAQTDKVEQSKRGYEIGAGDKVVGRVLGEPDFNFDAIVDEDGKIQVPFSNEGIVAVCRTEKELRSDVAKHLSKFLKNPQLSVNVVERNRPPAMVFGAVQSPQRIALARPATLLELLSFSGGLLPEANGAIQVTRTLSSSCSASSEDNWKATAENPYAFPTRVFNFKNLRETNPQIFPGDIIEVQKFPPVYVIGEVYKPGMVTIPEGGLPLMQAIAMSSGAGREAKLKEIKIYRRKEGVAQPEIITVDAVAVKKGGKDDMLLQPFDIVEVGKSPRSIGSVLLDIANGSVRNTANLLPLRLYP